jgi:hypothetical protein
MKSGQWWKKSGGVARSSNMARKAHLSFAKLSSRFRAGIDNVINAIPTSHREFKLTCGGRKVPVESLENRVLLSATWTVTSTADDDVPGTFRYAVNRSADGDTIQFDSAVFTPGTLHTITIGAPDPQLLIHSSINIEGPGGGARLRRRRPSRP